MWSVLDLTSAAATDAPPQLVQSKEIGGAIPTTFHAETVVCGAGPAGLLTAIMLAQRARRINSTNCNSNADDDNSNRQAASGQRTIHVLECRQAPRRMDGTEGSDSAAASDMDTPPAAVDAAAAAYSVGVFGRGKLALERFGLWETVVRPLAQELVGSQTWRSRKDAGRNGTTTMYADSGREPIYSLPRDTLVSALYQHIQDTYPDLVVFHFGRQVEPVSFAYRDKLQRENQEWEDDRSDMVLIKVVSAKMDHNGKPVDGMGCSPNAEYWTTDFLIGADGAARTVANKMEEVEAEEWQKVPLIRRLFTTITNIDRPFSVTRFPDDNPRVYKVIPLQLPDGWRKDIGYSASDFPKRRFSVVTLPSDTKGALCGVLLLKENEPLAQADTDPTELRRMLDDHLPVISDLISDDVVAAVAKNPVRQFPQFRYAGPRLHKGHGTVILGDACHSVKPYNGLGVNSAMEDVRILADCLEEEDTKAATTTGSSMMAGTSSSVVRNAIRNFSRRRAKDCAAVVTLSRAGDRPGRLGRMAFLVPLLMDAYFHKALPSVFEPPIPGLIHNSNYRFHQVAVRKRWERLAQVSILAVTAWLACHTINLVASTVATSIANGMSQTTSGVVRALAAPLTVGLFLARKHYLGYKKRSSQSDSNPNEA